MQELILQAFLVSTSVPAGNTDAAHATGRLLPIQEDSFQEPLNLKSLKKLLQMILTYLQVLNFWIELKCTMQTQT